jgi:Zn-dependent M16 (insulinase) family peptidase
MVFKGVVFNEMKGAYSSAAAVLGKLSQLSLYPDNDLWREFGRRSQGDPRSHLRLFQELPRAVLSPVQRAHRVLRRRSGGRAPRNARQYLGQFDAAHRCRPTSAAAALERAAPASNPRPMRRPSRAGKKTGMVSSTGCSTRSTTPNVLALNLCSIHVLVGNSAAPLRKALIDSGLGEGLTGSGSPRIMLQPYFTVGLKGIDEADGAKVEALILATLRKLADEGIDPLTIEAAMNSIEFALRENNTGSFPRGIALMFRSMRTWLHGGDPLEPLHLRGAARGAQGRPRGGRARVRGR